jgi:hypothetical protein
MQFVVSGVQDVEHGLEDWFSGSDNMLKNKGIRV